MDPFVNRGGALKVGVPAVSTVEVPVYNVLYATFHKYVFQAKTELGLKGLKLKQKKSG